MSEPATVVIPVERGTDWKVELPAGTAYIACEHDPGEWAQALTEGVQAAQTPLVILAGIDVRFKHDALDFLTDLVWDVDVTYGQVLEGDQLRGQMFCPHRLSRENYLPSVACVRRDKFLEVGGVQSGTWDLWVRMLEAGARFKYVPEAEARRDAVTDPSPTPVPDEVKATFYYQATPGTSYWRCLLPARHLPGQAIFVGPRREEQDGKLVMPQHQGTAVFQFTGNIGTQLVAQHLREAMGVRVLVEVDDNYTRWVPQQMRKASWHRSIADAPDGYSVEGHLNTVGYADGVICTTDHLAKQYRAYNENVYVCPNQIDPDDWPEPKKPDDGVFRIGWFASRSHFDDEKLVVRALEWASRQPDVEVVLVAVGSTNGKPWYKFPYKYRPWSNDFGVYRRFITELDVGLAPVVGTPWAVCRSDLKALEYAMAGALPIVSDQPPYKDCEIPGIVRCPDAKAFLRAVQWCVANKDEVRQLAAEARDYVLHERTVQHNIHLWEQACST